MTMKHELHSKFDVLFWNDDSIRLNDAARFFVLRWCRRCDGIRAGRIRMAIANVDDEDDTDTAVDAEKWSQWPWLRGSTWFACCSWENANSLADRLVLLIENEWDIVAGMIDWHYKSTNKNIGSAFRYRMSDCAIRKRRINDANSIACFCHYGAWCLVLMPGGAL